jgi:ferredoxin
MQVRVTDQCTGHGRCYAVAKDVYDADDEGYNVARGSTFDVSDDLAEQARLGAINCPESAITIIE